MSEGAFTNTAPFTSSSHWFLCVRVHNESTALESSSLARLVASALRRACGSVAASQWPVDVVAVDAARACAVLRCAAANVVAVRAALTLHTDVRVDVLQCEPTLALIDLPV
jgi:RNase P/RNase MRP subunit POP5